MHFPVKKWTISDLSFWRKSRSGGLMNQRIQPDHLRHGQTPAKENMKDISEVSQATVDFHPSHGFLEMQQ
jgi:hypothetical protein